MKGIFVTGSDTGVGKTIITGCLARFLSEKGYNAITQKWVQTGCRDLSSSDIGLHLKIMRRNRSEIKAYLPYALPYIFRTPCSPHLACRLENKTISSGKIKKSFKLLCRNFDFVIVEGAGGVLVPFDNMHFIVDIAAELNLPVLVVAQNKLGAINHTLLTIQALKARKLKILGIVLNNAKGQNKNVLQDNPRTIKSLSGEKVFGILAWEAGFDKLYKEFIPIGRRISREMING